MPVISIIGTSGVGKSFLVRQLASLDCCPGFFEGEEGVIPTEILDGIATEDSPMERGKWFLDRYATVLKRAQDISKKLNINCYLDVSIMGCEAIISFERPKYRKILQEMINQRRHIDADRFILLTMDENKIKDWIISRGRDSEQREVIFERAKIIQDAFVDLATKNKNTLIMDRTDLDFSKQEDLRKAHQQIMDFVRS